MAIALIACEKGGVGKSTIVNQLAILRAQQGRDVLVVDSDPQGSCSEFFKIREDQGISPSLTCVSITGRAVSSEIRKLSSRYEDIIIDAGGRDSAGLRAALVVSDILIVPFLAGQFDLWSVENMDALVEEALAINDSLKGYVLLNKADTNPNISLASEAMEVVANLKNLTPLDSKLSYRVAFRRSAAEGRAVNEMGKLDNKAIAEIELLYQEVYDGI